MNRSRILILIFVVGLALLPAPSAGDIYADAAQSPVLQSTRTVTAVVRSQGAVLYDVPGGIELETLVAGSLVTARLRTEDGQWVLVRTRDRVEGWVRTSALLAAGLGRLPVGEAAPAAEAQPPTATPEATAEPTAQPTALPTPQPDAQPTSLPSPTPAPTRFVPPEGPTALALVRITGANLWRLEDGSLAGRFKAGKRLTAAFRSADDSWYFVYDDAGVHGWATADEVLVVNGSSLPVDEEIPTEGSAAPEAEASSLAEEAAPPETPAGDGAESATGEAGTAGPVADEAVITVNDFGARLNVRAGPGTEFEIVAKAVAGVTFNGLGRSEDSEWVQVAIADLPSGTGWLAAPFVTSSVAIADLPVVVSPDS